MFHFLFELLIFAMWTLMNNKGMVKCTGPCYSISASGTIADAITFATWKGIAYAREWFTPHNPQSATQTNVRTALTICVASWQAQIVGDKALWDTFAEGTGMSGFNQYVSRAMAQYIIQLTSAVTPASVSYDHPAPGETWTWVAVV